MRTLTVEEVAVVAGGEIGISLSWRTYDSYFEVWGSGDRLATYVKNQSYLAAAAMAAAEGETLTRADFFGY